MKQGPNIQRRVADRLLQEGAISPEAHATALNFVSLHGGRMEDVLIEMNLVPEGELLKAISTAYATRFVSTQKLYAAQIEQRILNLVPRKLAEMHQLFPVIFDGEHQVLTVATADPDNLIAFQEVRLAASVRDVRPIVARPAAVAAAISRAYHADPQHFVALMRAGGVVQAAVAGVPQAAESNQGFVHPAEQKPRMATGPQGGTGFVFAPPMNLGGAEQRGALKAISFAPSAPDNGPPIVALERGAMVSSHVPGAFPDVAAPLLRAPVAAPAPAPERAVPPPPPLREPTKSQGAKSVGSPTLSRDYVETVTVLVSLLESARPDLRGHSAAVARVAQKICDRIGLLPEQSKAVALASHFHDLGKAGTYHLTALNVSEYEGHKTAAQKVVSVPVNVLSSVDLPADTKAAVGAMYERFDGKGLPAGLAGKDIPIGARVLAVADSYADLTQNPRNPARRILSPSEACAFLSQRKGTIFDPTIVDLLTHVVTGDDIRMKLLADRQTVLIVDPDPEETTVLELRLIEQGYEVRIARSMQQAVHELQTREVIGVVSEVDLDVEDDGLALRGRALAEPWGRDLVWVVHTKKSDRQLAQIVFDLGVDDFISKNTGVDVMVAKLKQLIEKKKTKPAAPRGVSGSLAEMALPDMVQILFHGRKSCALRITAQKGSGEIYFAEGQIVDARFGSARGEEGFYAMLALREGSFEIDPNAPSVQRTIQISPEGLLLEGMRRLDEGLAGG